MGCPCSSTYVLTVDRSLRRVHYEPRDQRVKSRLSSDLNNQSGDCSKARGQAEEIKAVGGDVALAVGDASKVRTTDAHSTYEESSGIHGLIWAVEQDARQP
ncbi:hypothetical protein Esi_0060_0070 [Ectocarpus siliculosus]|uniref:Uncharacterized protein n=1 Tax=Ectocarpus siliculosus TaxID=2880 RepID=D8LQS4_ECTSI|nr:hypothetical protein Esi_0060_0070 [Ectocarpus siliculosus]|eukprot:CBN74951.1 hypothetical protein Esi_0060_0070 [Ectocarpus siliculosus]